MKLWAIALGTWLILYGLDSVIGLSFRYESMVMGILALVAGVLVLVRK